MHCNKCYNLIENCDSLVGGSALAKVFKLLELQQGTNRYIPSNFCEGHVLNGTIYVHGLKFGLSFHAATLYHDYSSTNYSSNLIQ